MVEAKGLFDLEKHFAFYGAYHSNPANVVIHAIFVWPIFFTLLILLHFLHLGLLNLGLVVALLYAVFYFLMDPKAGSIAGLLCFLCWAAADGLAARLGFSLACKVLIVDWSVIVSLSPLAY